MSEEEFAESEMTEVSQTPKVKGNKKDVDSDAYEFKGIPVKSEHSPPNIKVTA